MAGMFLREKQMTSVEQNLAQTTTVFLFFTEHYYAKIEKTQLATRSIFSGKVFEEFQFCQMGAREDAVNFVASCNEKPRALATMSTVE